MNNKSLVIDLNDYNLNGFIHVGAGKGEYAKYYHRLGIHQVMWIEKETNLYSMIYETTKGFGMDQRIFMEELSNENSKEAKTFKTMWREQAAYMPVLDGFDGLHVACKENQVKVMQGFEEFFDIFRVVVLSKSEGSEEADKLVENYLAGQGFNLTTYSAEYTERLFVR